MSAVEIDPLGDLCIAAERDAEQENAVANTGTKVFNEFKKRHAAQRVEQVVLATLCDVYSERCKILGTKALPHHLQLLSEIPEPLVVKTSLLSKTPQAQGGAFIRVAEGGQDAQLEAFLTTLAPPLESPLLVLLDSLDLSGVHLPIQALTSMINNAILWGPWWRLRCLVLQDCDLELLHIRAMCSIEGVSSLSKVEHLNLSRNKDIGRDATLGNLRNVQDLAMETSFFLNLWRWAPIQELWLDGTELGGEFLRCAIFMLSSHGVPSNRGECGTWRHQGTIQSIRCLSIGPLGCESNSSPGWDQSIVSALEKLVAHAPNLQSLRLRGIPHSHKEQICNFWKTQVEGIGDHIVSGEDGLLYRNSYCHGTCLREDHLLPELDFIDQKHDDGEVIEYEMEEERELDEIGLGRPLVTEEKEETVQLVARLRNPDLKFPSISGRSNTTMTSNTYQKNQMKPKVQHMAGQGKRRTIKSTYDKGKKPGGSLYKGGDKNDELEVQSIGILSHSDEEGPAVDEDASISTDDDEKASGLETFQVGKQMANTWGQCVDTNVQLRAASASGISEKTFRLRDGILDEDSRMGKVFRMDARKKIRTIPHVGDQKVAKRAFTLWDECAENPWDRRRWENPSKSQNDEPHILGQLNLLYDMLAKHGMSLGFPFPKWKRGAGVSAFEDVKSDADNTSIPEIAGAVEGEREESARAMAANRSESHQAAFLLDDSQEARVRSVTRIESAKKGFLVLSDTESEPDNAQYRTKAACQSSRDIEDIVEAGEVSSLPTDTCASIPKMAFMKGMTANKQSLNSHVPNSDEQKGDSIKIERGSLAVENRIAETNKEQAQREEKSAAEEAIGVGTVEPPQVPTKEITFSIRRQRELARLTAWSWDARFEDHPPNSDVYGHARGKRTRKSIVSYHLDEEGLFDQQCIASSPKNSRESGQLVDGEWSSDDDIPLAQLKMQRNSAIIPDSQESDE